MTSSVLGGLGRIQQTQLNSDPQGTVYVDITYDILGRKATQSNPYRAISDATYGVTTYGYDALDRLTSVTSPSGGAVTTVYSGNCATVTDQAGKVRKSCSDALGRLTSVWEPNSAGSLVNETVYQYDVLDNLTRVDQKGNDPNSANWRTRTFVYNSLSQLTSATNPESGTVSYTYDNDGNLKTKTDARTVTITYNYDAGHRVTAKNYSDGTASVSYCYDGQGSCHTWPVADYNPIGRRTGMTDAMGWEGWRHDALGRILGNRRGMTGVPSSKAFFYSYNLDGSPKTLTYPSGRVISYSHDAVGRALSAVDAANSINYATQATYAPHGALASLKNGATGTFAGLTRNLSYNNRLQPVLISAASPTQTVLSFSYDFNFGVANNGNIKEIINNITPDRTQRFTYDELNRIKTAQTQADGGSYAWGQCFGELDQGNCLPGTGYDIWGNLKRISVSKGSASSLDVSINNQNRISSTGFTYDAAGNMTADGSNNYNYDAENRMTSAAGVGYAYDGDGRRVKKSNGKLYWYGISGEVLLETDLVGNNPTEYIFFGGKRTARRDTTGSVYYYFEDHLGSSRVITDANGNRCYDAEFYPFGGERVYLNTCPQNYKFTGKERDSESGLDFFIARYYSSQYGRFLSPDPENAAGLEHTQDPQSWNAYAYVRNNPLVFTDPNGESYKLCGTAVVDSQASSRCVEISSGDFGELRKSLEAAGVRFTVGGSILTRSGAPLGTYTDLGDDIGAWGLAVLPEAARRAEPGVNLAAQGLRAFGYVVAPPLMAASECIAAWSECSAGGTALALVPGGGRLVPLSKAARKVLGGLLPLAEQTVANAIRIRGGGGAQVNKVASWLQQKTVGEVANLAAQGSAEAKTAIKIIKRAAEYAEKH